MEIGDGRMKIGDGRMKIGDRRHASRQSE